MPSNFNDSIFAVLGEAIIDLIPNRNGELKPNPGGSPYNVARALGKQGMRTRYLSPLSQDSFGHILEKQLITDGVCVDENNKVAKPTSLAVVQLDEAGIPNYSLYREGIADREYHPVEIVARLPESLRLFHSGSLALVPQDIERVIEIIKVMKSRNILISIDFNFRANVVADQQAYVSGLESLIPYCDVLKASDEDLGMMGYTPDLDQIAGDLLSQMKQGLVVFTRGEKGACLYHQQYKVEFEGFRVDHLVDTVGAGDSFQAGMLSTLYREHGLDPQSWSSASESELKRILVWASACAAINVTREGCNPPNSAEVEAFLKLHGPLV
jgi:fructokinase